MTELSRLYGRSLYELARDEGIAEALLSQLDSCVELFGQNPDYTRLLSTPSITKEDRREAVGQAFDGHVHVYITSFLKILVDREAVAELPGCVEAFRQRYYEDNGIMEVTVTTAMELDNRMREKLLTRLDAVFGKKIILKEVVDRSVLGGMRLECAGKRYDGTVKDRLDRIEKGLRDTVL